MHRFTKLLFIPFGILIACSNTNGQQTENMVSKPTQEDLSKYSKAYFASGCFWCVEAIFQSVEGVAEAISGYTGGDEENPTYRQVSYGHTSHAEAVEVYYDPEVVSYETLLVVFFDSHDPTTLNRQGPDRGAQYRSGIYYQDDREKQAIDAHIQQLVDDGIYTRDQITTEVAAYKKFWPAEDYHQEYERLNPNQPYVRSVSIPRLNRFKAAHPELLKEAESLAH